MNKEINKWNGIQQTNSFHSITLSIFKEEEERGFKSNKAVRVKSVHEVG